MGQTRGQARAQARIRDALGSDTQMYSRSRMAVEDIPVEV